MIVISTVMKIRRMVLVDQRSIRSVSQELGLSRNVLVRRENDDDKNYVCN